MNLNLHLDISREEVINTTVDILRALTQAVIVHLMTYSIDGSGQLFDERTVRRFFYITISMIIFNLVVRRLFVPKVNVETETETKTKTNTK